MEGMTQYSQIKKYVVIAVFAVLAAIFCVLWTVSPTGTAMAADVITVEFEDAVGDTITRVYDAEMQSVRVTVTVNGSPVSSDDYRIEYRAADGTVLSFAPTDAGEYFAVVLVDGEESGGVRLNVLPADPVFAVEGLNVVYGDRISVSAIATGVDLNQAATVDYRFDYDYEQGVFPRCGVYEVVVSYPGSANYAAKTESFVLNVTPKPLDITVSAGDAYVYDGLPKVVYAGFSGLLQQDSQSIGTLTTEYALEGTAAWSATPPKEAGVYRVRFSYSDPNYYVDNDAIEAELTKLTILKKNLTVSVADTGVALGSQPSFRLTYTGFVGDETTDVLDVLPTVNASYDAPGVYTVVASGGEARNYNFLYVSGKLTVYRAGLTASSGDLTVSASGQFSPDASLTVDTVDKNSDAGAVIVGALKNSGLIAGASYVDGIYRVKVVDGKIESGTVRFLLKGISASKLFAKRIAVVNDKGEVSSIGNFVLQDDELSLSAYSDGYIVVYQSRTALYWIAGVLIFLVLIIVLLKVGFHIQYKRMKKRKTVEVKDDDQNYTYRW